MASTRFCCVNRRNNGDRVPEGTTSAVPPAVAAMAACVRSPLPIVSRTRRDWSGVGNSASNIDSGTPKTGDAGSAPKRLDDVADTGRGAAVAIRGRRQELCNRPGLPYLFFAGTKGASAIPQVRPAAPHTRPSSHSFVAAIYIDSLYIDLCYQARCRRQRVIRRIPGRRRGSAAGGTDASGNAV